MPILFAVKLVAVSVIEQRSVKRDQLWRPTTSTKRRGMPNHALNFDSIHVHIHGVTTMPWRQGNRRNHRLEQDGLEPMVVWKTVATNSPLQPEHAGQAVDRRVDLSNSYPHSLMDRIWS